MQRRHRRGLSLIEIIVVITIISLLMSAVGVYALARYRWPRTRRRQLHDAWRVRTAAEASDAPRAVRLHAAFGFPMEERAKACARLRGLNGNRQYKELEKACGEPPSSASQGP